MENDLVELLGDPVPAIARAARQGLVRMARGTDFGPVTGTARARTLAAWKDWLTLQETARADRYTSATATVETAPAGQGRGAGSDEVSAVELRAELLRSGGAAQEEVLRRLTEARGVSYTEVLAQAIPRLPESLRAKARAALVERMTRMTAQTLRDKFAQNDAEVRRAAVMACASKGDKHMVPDLIERLRDSDGAVAQAARSALKKLTGEDFGAVRDALRSEQGK